MTTPWGVYVHVPWCRVRCPYCAFHVVPDRPGAPLPAEAYVDRVLALRRRRAADGFAGAPHTIYLGGGTPSRLPDAALTRLLSGLDPSGAVEVTLEANPEDVDAARIARWRDAGVTRLSLGVQTLQPALARRLGRAHTPADARAALDRVAGSALATWSVDLMFALPGQSPDDLDADLDALTTWSPPHVSLYGLTYEPGTAFARARDRGTFAELDEDAWSAQLDRLEAWLREHGLDRYEISNAARPGHEGRHNQGYWTDRPYLGLGPSAHSYAPDGRRWVEREDTAAWLAADEPRGPIERPDARARATERLLSGLRGRDGLALAPLIAATGLQPAPARVRPLVAGGLLVDDPGRLALTPRGMRLADGVIARLVDALAPAGAPTVPGAGPLAPPDPGR